MCVWCVSYVFVVVMSCVCVVYMCGMCVVCERYVSVLCVECVCVCVCACELVCVHVCVAFSFELVEFYINTRPQNDTCCLKEYLCSVLICVLDSLVFECLCQFMAVYIHLLYNIPY